MNVVGYVRVTKDRQAEQGLDLEVQKRALEAWAKENRHRITSIHQDEGGSGSNHLQGRMGLAEALERLRDGEAQGLVVYRLDRLARDLMVQEGLLADIWKMGGEIFSTIPSESGYLTDDPDDPSRKFIRQVLGAMAEYERGMVALRLRLGRKRKAERGGFAFGSPPYGYRSEHRELVTDEQEGEALKMIHDLRKEGKSLPAICSALEAAGHRPKRGDRWHPTSVWRILKRDEPSTNRPG